MITPIINNKRELKIFSNPTIQSKKNLSKGLTLVEKINPAKTKTLFPYYLYLIHYLYEK
jgi:hypothetical protein